MPTLFDSIADARTPVTTPAPTIKDLPKQKLYVFPNDLGEGSYWRKSEGDVKPADYYFINFGIVTPKHSPDFHLDSSAKIVDTKGNKINNWRGRDVSSADLSPLLRSGYSTVTDTNIALYMPEEVKVGYTADLVTVDQGLIASYVNNSVSTGLGSSVDFVMSNIQSLLKSGGLSLTGAESAENLFAQYLGKDSKAVNPSTEQLFKNMKNRQFHYNFKLVPRNAAEGKTIQNILKLFKFHMHPAVSQTRTEFYFPSLFIITYYRSGEIYEELHKVGACYLESLNVDYAGAGQFHAFRDGQPVQVNIELQFREAVVLTKDSIAKGY